MRVNRAVVGYAIKIALLVLATVLLGLLLGYKPGQSSGTPPAVFVQRPYTFERPAFEKVLANDNLELYFDRKSAGIKLVDLRNGKTWHSVLEEADRSINNVWQAFFSSGVTLEHIDGRNTVRRLNSARDGETSFVDVSSDHFSVAIAFPDVGAVIEVKYTLGVDFLDISVTGVEEGAIKLTSLYLYPFMGASKGTVPGSFLIPDGIGAGLDLSKKTIANSPFVASVYGLDKGFVDIPTTLSLDTVADPERITLPFYAVTTGEAALLGVITGGDLYAEVQAYKSGIVTPFNWITTRFIYRQMYRKLLNKKGEGVSIPQAQRNPVSPALRFYFLDGSNSSPSGIAAKAREDFLLRGLIPSRRLEPVVPLKLEFLVAESEKTTFGIKVHIMTPQSELERILAEVGKYSQRTVVVLRGYTSGGLSTSSPDHLPLERKAIEDISRLSEFYFYVDYLTAHEGSGGVSRARYAQNRSEQIMIEGPRFIIDPRETVSFALEELESFSKLGIEKFALANLAELAFSTRDSNRTENVEALLETVSLFDGPILYNPNLYMISRASHISDIPVSNSGYLIEDSVVPLLPAVLRESFWLFTGPVNLTSDFRRELLRAVDYGLFPSFYITSESSMKLVETASSDLFSTEYENWREKIEFAYDFVSKALENTLNSRLVERVEVAAGLFRNTYDNGTSITLNYNENPARAGDLEIEPLSYVVEVNR